MGGQRGVAQGDLMDKKPGTLKIMLDVILQQYLWLYRGTSTTKHSCRKQLLHWAQVPRFGFRVYKVHGSGFNTCSRYKAMSFFSVF